MAAQVLAGSGVRVLGMVLPHMAGTYYAELAVGFETRASELDCSVLILQANRVPDRRTAIRNLTGQADATAFMAKSAVPDQYIADTALNRPVVTVARTQLPGVPATYAESERSSEQLTSHLIATGRRRLAVADLATGESQMVDGLAPDRALTSLATDGETLFAGTWIFGGTGSSNPPAKEGSMLAIDPDTFAVKWQTTPVPGATSYVGAQLDGDGRLWALAENTLVEVDPATGEQVRTVELDATFGSGSPVFPHVSRRARRHPGRIPPVRQARREAVPRRRRLR